MDIDHDAPVTTRREIHIAAPIAGVWALHTDVDSWPRWQKDISSATLQGSFAVGSTFVWSTTGLTDIPSTIGELAVQRRVAWSGTTQGITGRHVWTFEPDDGGTVVTTAESWSGEPVVRNLPLLQDSLDTSLTAWLTYLKTEAESQIP